MSKKIICNPLNLEYRYQNRIEGKRRSLSREAADPTMILFKDTYLLFASMSGGFWYSDDLVSWEFHATPELPVYDYAPDVRLIGDRIVFSASSHGKCRFYTSKNPLTESFVSMPEAFPWWDPDIFQDDDGKVYFYWGCSTKPIHGVEVDPKTLQPVGKKVEVIKGTPEIHGWERKGENNTPVKPVTHMEKMMEFILGKGPFIEGAYMTKYNGRYYLQYAAPGTEFNVYGDGVYVSDKPLGPFHYQRHNPFSSVPGGFIRAAGHGSTFQDKKGQWWHVSTMLIGVNEKFERRIGLFPCDFDEEGTLHCDQELADYPLDIEKREKMNWMLLDGKMSASSCERGFEAEKAHEENIKTWWAAQTNSETEWLLLDLESEKTVNAIQINFADHRLQEEATDMVKLQTGFRKIFVEPQNTSFLLEGSLDGKSWSILRDRTKETHDYCHDFFCLKSSGKFRYLRLSHMQMPFGGVPAVSGLRVFGNGGGKLPQKVTGFTSCRKGDLNIFLNWEKAEGAVRYNVRYGLAPDRLYNSWQTEENHLDLSFITAGETYYAAVDSINENGITKGDEVKLG